jgi:drug/metabolite transporter (DMT)-like permease
MSQKSAHLENMRCISYMIIAMAGFAIEDAIIKQLSNSMPISQILILIGIGGLVIFSLAARYWAIRILSAEIKNPRFLIRSLCELAAAISFVTAIVEGSLSISSAIIQATPLAVVIGGAFFLKQQVSGLSWALVLTGFIGVLMVTQPGLEGFKPATLFAVAAVFFLAIRDIITRSISDSIPVITISFWAFFASLSAGLITVPFFEPFQVPSSKDVLLVTASVCTASFAYCAVVLATRAGEISVVAPFRYTRLLFALGLSVVFFDENINGLMLLGSVLIATSGVLMLAVTQRQ